MPATLDRLLEQNAPSGSRVISKRIAMIANEPWRSFETLFLKLKTANDDDFTVWQAGLRLAPPVQSAERWLGITLSSTPSVASVQHPIQPVR